MQGWVKAARILAVVNKGSTYALVILLTTRTPPQVYSDLTTEKVLPIDEDFKCDIGKLYFCTGNYYFFNILPKNELMIIN